MVKVGEETNCQKKDRKIFDRYRYVFVENKQRGVRA